MASKYLTASAFIVYDGDVALAADLNSVTSAVEAGFDTVLQDFASIATEINNAVSYSTEWANAAEDVLVSAAAGGDLIDDYSALHHAAKAAISAAAALASETAAALSETNAGADATQTALDRIATAADAASTAADALATAADAVATAADVVLTTADAAQTALDAASTAADALATAADAAATAADAIATAADVVLTAADAAATAIDAAATAADVLLTAADAAATAVDAVATAADAIATAADRVQTGLDVLAAAASAAAAAASAASLANNHDSLNNVMLPTDWQTVNKQGWDHFGFNQQWGGAPWGGRLADGTDGEVATGYFKPASTTTVGGTVVQKYEMGFKIPISGSFKSLILPYFSKVGNPTDNAEVNIYEDSAGNPGTLVTNGTAVVAGKTIASSGADTIFTFATPISLTADTLYHFEVARSGTNSDINLYRVAYSGDNDYPFGDTQYWNGTTWVSSAASLCFKLLPTAATSTILNGEFNASDTTQLGQAPALTQSLKDVIKRDKDGKFTFQFKVGDVPTASKPLCQAYYDNDTHITVETDALSHAIIRSNGSTITGTSILAADDSIAAMYNGTNLALYVNGVAEGIVVAASYPDDFDTGSFIIGGAIPTDLTWTKETDMSLLPSADGWTYTGTATEASAFSVSGGKLYQNAAGYTSLQNGYYEKTTTFNNATGWKAVAKVQVLSSTNNDELDSVQLQVADGTYSVRIRLNEYFINIISTDIRRVHIDLKTKPVVLEVIGKGNDIHIFADGKLIFDGIGTLTSATATNRILIGDNETVAEENADAIWHYVNYIESYEAPTFTTTPLYDFGFWQKDASSLLVDLAASDVKSITGLKRDWVEEAERVIAKKGVVSSPTTTSAGYTEVEDQALFTIGSDVVIHSTSYGRNSSVGGTLDVVVGVDGVVGLNYIGESSTANDRIAVTIAEYREVNHGMHYAAVLWSTNSGTETLLSRQMISKAK